MSDCDDCVKCLVLDEGARSGISGLEYQVKHVEFRKY